MDLVELTTSFLAWSPKAALMASVSVVAVGLVVAVAWQGTEEATVTVLRASLEDSHTKALLESHGSMIVRLRMTQEEDRP